MDMCQLAIGPFKKESKSGNFTIYHLVAYSSNHQPILLLPDTQPGDATLRRRGPPCFHFEEQWVTDEECEHIIQAGCSCQEVEKAMPYVISEYQSVFIPNRMILDNVLAAFEAIHCLKRRGKMGHRRIILKLDVAKAYDRGLRQGDPLSSYLFLIVVEGFSTLLQKVDCDSRVCGISIALSTPSINHLFFADDNLLFYDAESSQIMKLKCIFGLYEAAS
ncbi:hypothetical protein PRUPE_4G274400 [Prunus persica]|uniref:Reverse transcriptase domain-containing protein n=1 Tax=Prunus persica TaxID=3760 RepID=M5WKW3_PRUPE|nr:hypothetical protein PRUPE_4G274400 [Prunus persica]